MRKEPSLKRQGGPGAVLTDDNAPDCEGFYCERVMISAYKALILYLWAIAITLESS
ncbi:hypothetical protein CAMRE0001_1168 [Campylobacter rectus RM3267]|uniref:Uncharacterized protein n=2 Tax=Campylobacter rectus TaxID=203 RepID=A0A6G5QL55_CAMRE|nr:hypothetical protein CAMRE0001_1168 [Campylobacter rectus RM3267]QCD46317.1 hypothetical protein CRECT_0629 [Campylobacter rectus]